MKRVLALAIATMLPTGAWAWTDPQTGQSYRPSCQMYYDIAYWVMEHRQLGRHSMEINQAILDQFMSGARVPTPLDHVVVEVAGVMIDRSEQFPVYWGTQKTQIAAIQFAALQSSLREDYRDDPADECYIGRLAEQRCTAFRCALPVYQRGWAAEYRSGEVSREDPDIFWTPIVAPIRMDRPLPARPTSYDFGTSCIGFLEGFHECQGVLDYNPESYRIAEVRDARRAAFGGSLMPPQTPEEAPYITADGQWVCVEREGGARECPD